MKYIEIKMIEENREGYFEGRFYVIATDKYEAVEKAITFLEITDISKWKIFTRELSAESYFRKVQNAEKENERKNEALRFLKSYGVCLGEDNVRYDGLTTRVNNTCYRSFIERLSRAFESRYPNNDTFRRNDRLSC